MTTGQRILFNGIATYGRNLFAIALGLFSSRWVLEALGEVDYGLMGVVGSLLIFITFLNTLATAASARFFAFSIGKNDKEDTNHWFNVALSIETILPLTLILLGWPIGEWAIRNFLSIPDLSLNTAIWVFRISLINAFFVMACTPFVAMYTAKQNIAELSLWGIVSASINFFLAYWLTTYDGNTWLVYCIGTTVINILLYTLQSVRASYKYDECRIKFDRWFNKVRIKEMLSYSGWTLFGAMGGIFNSNGIAIVLNKFFSPSIFPSVNASYSVGINLASKTNSLAGAMLGAFLPEIVSSEGRGDRNAVYLQVFRAARMSFMITAIFALPLFFQAHFILDIWLKNPPEHSVLFCITFLSCFLIGRLQDGFDAAICATGKIKWYQIIMSSFAYISVAIAAVVLWLGGGLLGLCLVLVSYNLANTIGGVLFGRYLLSISVKLWLKNIVRPAITVLAINLSIGFLLNYITSQLLPVYSFIIVAPILMISTFICGWLIITSQIERKQILSVGNKLINKMIKRH